MDICMVPLVEGYSEALSAWQAGEKKSDIVIQKIVISLYDNVHPHNVAHEVALKFINLFMLCL